MSLQINFQFGSAHISPSIWQQEEQIFTPEIVKMKLRQFNVKRQQRRLTYLDIGY